MPQRGRHQRGIRPARSGTQSIRWRALQGGRLRIIVDGCRDHSNARLAQFLVCVEVNQLLTTEGSPLPSVERTAITKIVATGNITNNELLASFERHLETIVSTFDDADMVELRQDQLIARPRA